ncbi:MAG: replicative helicase [Chloroflexota bacterium]|jgi:replicative DNA helicase|nr:replicative helicase [Chloroflexota bacterium]
MAVELATDRSFEPLPPHNTEAEESVLGSLLIDPEAIEAVANFLHAADFYHPRNRDVYGAMLRLFERRQPTDFVMVCDELERAGQLDAIGGFGYLSRILTVVPTSINVESYARVVERTAVMRRLIGAAGRIAAIGYGDHASVQEALDKAEQELFGVTQFRVEREFMHIRDVLSEYLEQIQLGSDAPAASAAVPTGFIDLDRLLGGFQRSDLIILAARPSLGKTALALNIARNAGVKFNQTTGIFSVEMSRWQIAQRFLSTESDVDSSRVREGRLTDADLRKLVEGLETLSRAPIYIDDTPGITISELRAKARRLHADHPLDLIVVDYLQLVSGSVPENRVQAISEVTRSLKGLARELNVPVLALSQLSRAVEGRSPHIPMLSDLRDSGSIEQDADVVIFIYREDVYDRETERKGITELHVAKHRNGPTGVIELLFMERSTRFVDLGEAPRV